MKRKYLLLIIPLLILCLFAGCKNKPVESKQQEKNEESIKVKIFMTPCTEYLGHEEVKPKETEVKEPFVKLYGSKKAYIDICFLEDVDIESAKKSIKIKGYDKEISFSSHKNDNKKLFFSIENLKNDKKYKLVINKDIKFLNGDNLGKNIEIDFVLEEDTKAVYTIEGIDEKYANMGVYDVSLLDDFGDRYFFTNSPKTILIDFSREVDKRSVEVSIGQEWAKNSPEYTLSWENPQRLKMNITKFLPLDENNRYRISMEYALDKEKRKIIGDFRFVVGEKNSIYEVDTKTMDKRLIKVFNDKRFMPLSGNIVEDNWILYDGIYGNMINFKNGKVTRIEMPNNDFYPMKLVNKNELLILNRMDNNILKYTISNGKKNNIITDTKGLTPVRFAISPDKSKVAVEFDKISSEISDVFINVYDLRGNLIKSFDGLLLKELKSYHSVSSIGWIDKNTIIYSADMLQDGNVIADIYSINIKTKEKKKIIESGQYPIANPKVDLIKYSRCKTDNNILPGDTVIVKDNKILDEFIQSNDAIYSNFKILDKNRIAFNRGKGVVVYDLRNKTEKYLGEGYIFGISPDGNKVYYMTNYYIMKILMGHSDNYYYMETEQ